MSLFRNGRKRAEMLERFAGENGLIFIPGDEMGFVRYFNDFKLFRMGGGRRILCLLRKTPADYEGDHGLFDYRYVVQSGKTPVHFFQTVYYCLDKELSLPHFRIFPERLKHRIGKWFGQQDIDLPVYPDFSDHYILRGQDEEQVKLFFGQNDVISHFNTHRDWHVEGLGYYAVMYKHNKLADDEMLSEMLDAGKRLMEVLIRRSHEMDNLSAR